MSLRVDCSGRVRKKVVTRHYLSGTAVNIFGTENVRCRRERDRNDDGHLQVTEETE